MKHKLRYAEFYITNVCNYSCNHCNSFNNFAFKGHQRWADFKEIYADWSKRVDLSKTQIIGGEPTLNPDFLDWVKGITSLWPNTEIEIVTNGSKLDFFTEELYETLKNHNARAAIVVSCHNTEIYNSIIEKSEKFLKKPITTVYKKTDAFNQVWVDNYNAVKAEDWPECNTLDDFQTLPEHIKLECELKHKFSIDMFLRENAKKYSVDINGVEVVLNQSQFFELSAITIEQNGKMTLRNSDPVKAHDRCHCFRGCHQFNKGKLYKCPVASTLGDLDKQFDLDISDNDRSIIHDYQPLTLDNSDQEFEDFINNHLPNPIPHCKFCIENTEWVYFVGTDKKIKIIQ